VCCCISIAIMLRTGSSNFKMHGIYQVYTRYTPQKPQIFYVRYKLGIYLLYDICLNQSSLNKSGFIDWIKAPRRRSFRQTNSFIERERDGILHAMLEGLHYAAGHRTGGPTGPATRTNRPFELEIQPPSRTRRGNEWATRRKNKWRFRQSW
jgi:hypothetical protein